MMGGGLTKLVLIAVVHVVDPHPQPGAELFGCLDMRCDPPRAALEVTVEVVPHEAVVPVSRHIPEREVSCGAGGERPESRDLVTDAQLRDVAEVGLREVDRSRAENDEAGERLGIAPPQSR